MGWGEGVSLFEANTVLAIKQCFTISRKIYIPYFFAYKTEFLFFQNNPKDLDPSCKTDLDLLDCLGRVNLVL